MLVTFQKFIALELKAFPTGKRSRTSSGYDEITNSLANYFPSSLKRIVPPISNEVMTLVKDRSGKSHRYFRINYDSSRNRQNRGDFVAIILYGRLLLAI